MALNCKIKAFLGRLAAKRMVGERLQVALGGNGKVDCDTSAEITSLLWHAKWKDLI